MLKLFQTDNTTKIIRNELGLCKIKFELLTTIFSLIIYLLLLTKNFRAKNPETDLGMSVCLVLKPHLRYKLK